MKVTTITPDEYLGDVIGDFNSRRGQIQYDGAHPGCDSRLQRWFRLSEMFGYATDLRSKNTGTRSVFYGAEPLC